MLWWAPVPIKVTLLTHSMLFSCCYWGAQSTLLIIALLSVRVNICMLDLGVLVLRALWLHCGAALTHWGGALISCKYAWRMLGTMLFRSKN